MNQRQSLHRALAFLSFLIPFIVYYLTAWPSISYGDSGELAAAVVTGGVTDGPGAPLWTMIARTFIALVPGDAAAGLILFSMLAASLTSMVVYLLITSLERINQQMSPERRGGVMFWPGLLGALSFAWFDSEWSTATTISVHSVGTLITALVLWSGFRWYEQSLNRQSEPTPWLLLACWFLGLSLGIDRTVAGLLPALGLLVWLRQMLHGREEGGKDLGAGLMAMAGLLLLWQVIIAGHLFISLVILLLGAIGLIVPAHLRRAGFVAIFGVLFILLGYTSYVATSLRSGSNPPINAYDGEGRNESIISYMAPPPEAIALPTYLREKAEGGSLRYNVGHVYTRYLLWNLVGRISDVKGSPSLIFGTNTEEDEAYIAPSGSPDSFPVRFFALPFLLVLIGFVHHYRRDWRSALVLTTAFLSLGPLLALLIDLPESTPWEGDHFFTSSFMIASLWIGLAGSALAGWFTRWSSEVDEEEEMEDERGEDSEVIDQTALSEEPVDETDSETGEVRSPILTLQPDEAEEKRIADREDDRSQNIMRGVALLTFLLVPINLLYNGWDLHRHSGNATYAEFAANTLLSCDSNAILFVDDREFAGAILYAQYGRNIRPDVRVVEIERLTLPSYRKHLRLPQGESDGILLSGTGVGREDLIDSIREVRLRGPVLQLKKGETEADSTGQREELTTDTILWQWTGIEADSGMQRYRLEHQKIREIVEANYESRPIAFSVMVDPSWWSGLDRFFRWQGLVYTVLPGAGLRGIEGYSTFAIRREKMEQFLGETRGEKGTAQFYLNSLGDRSVDITARDLVLARVYRRAFIALAADAIQGDGAKERGSETLLKMDRTIPLETFSMRYWTAAAVAMLLSEAGEKEGAERYADHAIAQAAAMGERWRSDPVARRYNPYQITASMYRILGDYDEAIRTYQSMERGGKDPVIRGLIEELRVERHLSKGDTAAARKELTTIIADYQSVADPALEANLNAWQGMLDELSGKESGEAEEKDSKAGE